MKFTIKVKGLALSVLIIFTLSLPSLHAQGPNYCLDKENWKDWDKLVAKYPHDLEIQMLHAVFIGFCKKIEDGSIKFEVARDAFNHLHETVYKRSVDERDRWLRNKQL